ncbi:MAG: 3-dehydroquinate synthase [Deltaproteobacteria bacterium]|nr:3-dehydroquinate synthase [Deltaproteobacteria bacterium]
MREIEQEFAVSFRYPVIFTRAVFAPENATLADVLARAGEGPHRAVVVVDENVLRAWPDLAARITAYAGAHPSLEIVAEPHVVPGGEASKSDPSIVDELHRLLAQHGVCRHSFVLAIGGGSVLDAAGYAAALVHRGVRLLRVPTTVLAQNDAGIGVKNAVNFQQRKNFLGTFVPPFAVLNDLDFLETLSARDRRSGVAEAVKVALIRDAKLFCWLHENRERLARFEPEATEEMVVRCAELHLEHIRTSGDPFELGSARPLDFGHWAAHKLEELSGYELRHGEAVAAGIALDSLYANRKGLIADEARHAIFETLDDLGFDVALPVFEHLDVEQALEDFRAHLGGNLCVTLIDRIGHGVDVREIDVGTMRSCVADLRNHASRPH